MHFSEAPYKKSNYLNPSISTNEVPLDNCYVGLQSVSLINNLAISDESFSTALGCNSSSLFESRFTSGMIVYNDSVDKIFNSRFTSDLLKGPGSTYVSPNFELSLVKLIDRSYIKAPEPLYAVDGLLMNKIAIGAEHLLKVPNTYRDFFESVKKIDENKIYNTEILFNDLNDLVKPEVSDNFFKRIGKLLGFTDQTNIDSLFEQLGNLSPIEFIELDDVAWTYKEVNSFLEQRNHIENHLKLKALARFIKSQLQNVIEHEQSRISLVSPIIMHLREYLDNIFNIKRIYLGTISNQFRDVNILNIIINGFKRQNRVIMLAFES